MRTTNTNHGPERIQTVSRLRHVGKHTRVEQTRVAAAAAAAAAPARREIVIAPRP